jgi:hypothetical protein
MPSIRDLRGRPVEETVSSRETPGAPAGAEPVERDAVREAVAKVWETRSPRAQPDGEEDRMGAGESAVEGDAATALTGDMSKAIVHLDATLQQLGEMVRHAREQLGTIRERAGKDAARVAKLAEVFRSLD